MERVEELIWKLRDLKKYPEGFLYDYFEKVKRDVDLRREILKQEIDTYSDLVIKQIEDAHAECKILSAKIEDISTQMESYTDKLNKLKDNFNTLDADQLEKKMEDNIRQIKYSLLQNKYFSCQFEEINIENIFGKVSYENIGEFVLDREVKIDVDRNEDVYFFFDNKNDMFATKEYENSVNIWNAKTGVLVKELDVAGHCVVFIRSRYIAVACTGTGTCSNEIRIYDKDDEFNLIATLDNEYIIASLVFVQNLEQDLLVSGYENGTVKVWDPKTWSLIKIFKEHTDRVHSIVFDQNSLVATSSRDGTIKIWKTDSWEQVQTLDEERNEVAFTHSNMLVVLKKFSTIKIWCSESWSLVKTLENTGPQFCSIATSKSNLLAVGCKGGKILIFNTKNWDLFQKLEAHGNMINGELFIDQNDFLSYRYDYDKVMKWKMEKDFLN